jgi:coenzyme F420-dependent glucose-6-phosphate dehydrogenase
MSEIGYALSSEEHDPNDLIHYAQRAEAVGFTFALVSDHYHPWTDRQGHSPFVWSVIGGIAHATQRLRLGTGVTCPTMRIHPAIIAQAAATAATMMPDRFFLGVGTGENLNEHILGAQWPAPKLRLEMLEEAITIMRLLWQGGSHSYQGTHYTVENARIYTLPDNPPLVLVAASKKQAINFAARIGDGLISLEPQKKIIDQFTAAGGTMKPSYGQLTVCWAATEALARTIAYEWWPTAGLPGDLNTELALPQHFEQAASVLTEDLVAKTIVCGPDPEVHIAKIQEYIAVGYDYVYIHQVGPDQEGFFRFYGKERLPKFQ